MNINDFLERADVIQIKDIGNPWHFIFISRNADAPLTKQEQTVIKMMLTDQFGTRDIPLSFDFKVEGKK